MKQMTGVERDLKLVHVEKARIDDDIALQKNKALVIQDRTQFNQQGIRRKRRL